MSLRINTNVAALDSYRNLSMNQAKLQDSFQKLSSGLRINKAADDASGLAISQHLTSQVNGLTQAVSNANDAIDVAQIADGAMGTAQDVLQRMRTLVVQASNSGTQDSNSLSAIQSEITSLNDELDKVSSTTKFGGKNLLDGTYTGAAATFQVGANSGDTIALDLSTANVSSTSLATNGIDVTATTTGALASIDTALQTVSTARASVGATQNQLNYTVTNLQTAIQNVSASRSNITDADLATEVTSMTQAQILTQAATSVLAQANSAPQSILKLLQ